MRANATHACGPLTARWACRWLYTAGMQGRHQVFACRHPDVLRQVDNGKADAPDGWPWLREAATVTLGPILDRPEEADLDEAATVIDLSVLWQVNIGKADAPEDWRLREAATFAFGSILDGPPPDKLAALVAVGLPFLLNALKDPHTAVRHTTAWTIGAACATLRQKRA